MLGFGKFSYKLFKCFLQAKSSITGRAYMGKVLTCRNPLGNERDIEQTSECIKENLKKLLHGVRSGPRKMCAMKTY